MSNDFFLVLGTLILALAFPSLVSAFSSSRRPTMAIFLLVVGGALVSWAIVQTPGGYSFEEIPRVFTGVFAKFIR